MKDNAAGQAWYDSLIRQYADWGVDLLKVDCIADHPYKVSEIRQIRRAIDKTGRKMVLSLSPGPTNPSHAAEVASLGNMWRISNDFWDIWNGGGGPDGFPQSLKGQFDRLATWSQFDLKPGQWPDADMLPFGELRPSPGWGEPRHTRLTPDEQKTVMTLWAITQSPLILGANLTMLDEDTLKLLTNREVLRLDQDAIQRGKPLAAVNSGGLRVWRAVIRGSHGEQRTAVAFFNLNDSPAIVSGPDTQFGLQKDGRTNGELVDAWAGKSLGRIHDLHLSIPPHGCVLLEQQ